MAVGPFEGTRNILAFPTHIRRLLPKDGGHSVNLGVAGEGTLAGAHLVKDRAKTEDVAAMIHRLAAQLLWRHVANGSEPRPDLGLGRHACSRAGFASRGTELG